MSSSAASSKQFWRSINQLTLYSGASYFVAMATAHFFGLKYPLLFVYYDTPFHAYQDKIIAFCVAVYVALFVNATQSRAVVPTAVASMWITTIGLSLVNVSDDLAKVLKPGQTTTAYWLQTAVVGAITAVLTVSYFKSK